MNGRTASDERIVLNVGGIKYETYRSTLKAFPHTLLGTMFSERNKDLLHPENNNEYFFDRDGYVFRYIIQYYRTGEAFSPDEDALSSDPHARWITRRELEVEFDYFQIPMPRPSSSISQATRLSPYQAIYDKVDDFIEALKSIVYVVLSNFKRQVSLTFFADEMEPRIDDLNSPMVSAEVFSLAKPYTVVGYHILSRLGDEIGRHFERINTSLRWNLVPEEDYKICLALRFEFQHIPADKIILNTCLKETAGADWEGSSSDGRADVEDVILI